MGGSNCRLQIFERLRKSMNNIIFGKAGIQWFCASMKEVVALPSEQNVVKTFREAWWVMIFQKNKNERGQYILVLEYGAKNSKGSIVIPEGKNRWEWRGICQKIQSILALDSKGKTATTVVDIGRKTLAVMENNKLHESLSFKNVLINNVITPMTLGKERADLWSEITGIHLKSMIMN